MAAPQLLKPLVFVLVALISGSEGFSGAQSLAFLAQKPLLASPATGRACPRICSLTSVKMGFFDELMGGGEGGKVSTAPPTNPQVTGLEPIPGKVLVTFKPSGAQIHSNPGERLGDIARRAGLEVPYGCREGVCGTCSAVMKQPNGFSNDVRLCKDSVPRTNLDCPDREKMWGDLRGGKKSLGELRSTPEELTVIISVSRPLD
mmetsp:Transcript_19116/g.29899  ORF Transcript_19116/g.29899 Transcript_19116/m.29899 type:complete len:203 (-) Transcript_19116:439-1047(-)